jgi:hypothetical protein
MAGCIIFAKNRSFGELDFSDLSGLARSLVGHSDTTGKTTDRSLQRPICDFFGCVTMAVRRVGRGNHGMWPPPATGLGRHRAEKWAIAAPSANRTLDKVDLPPYFNLFSYRAV